MQSEEDLTTLRVTRYSLKLIIAALDLVSTSRPDVMGSAEQGAWRCEVM